MMDPNFPDWSMEDYERLCRIVGGCIDAFVPPGVLTEKQHRHFEGIVLTNLAPFLKPVKEIRQVRTRYDSKWYLDSQDGADKS